MKSLAAIATAVVLSASLAACNRQAPTTDKNAARPNTTPMAQGADTPKADTFKSAVTGKSAPGSPQAVDAELSSKVKVALTSAPEIKTGALEVASSNGVVTLYGTVDAPVEKDRAAMLAMEVDGVRSVVNNLVVVKGS